MPGNGAEIYKTCREAAGLTQEQASEGLNCSVRSLARYESGEQHVPDDIAYQMVVLYDSQLLAVQHLRLVSQVAADLFPPVTERAFVEAAMRIFNRVRRFAERHQGYRLLEIAEDNVISPEEEPLYREIVGELLDIEQAHYCRGGGDPLMTGWEFAFVLVGVWTATKGFFRVIDKIEGR